MRVKAFVQRMAGFLCPLLLPENADGRQGGSANVGSMMQARLTLLLTGVLLLGAGGLGYGQGYFFGPSQLELPPGAVQGTDSYGPYADIATDGDSGLLALTTVMVPGGRYRATYLLRTPPFGRSEAIVKLYIEFNAPPVRLAFIREVTGPNLPGDGSVYSLSMEVAVPAGELYLPLTYRVNEARELTTVRIYGLSLTRLDGGLALTKVRPRKLLYEPGEAGVVDVTVQSFAEEEMSGTLQLTLIQELDRADPQAGVPITVAAGEAVEVALPFGGRTLEYGCEARVRLTQGEEVLDEVSDVFGVSDNVFDVGLGSPSLGISGQSGYATAETIASDVERCRQSYANWWEKMFWPPDDWGDMTPETEEWISGQSARWENASRIREFVAALKPHGIKAITYGKHVAGGPAGWERVRQHPEWFYALPQGTPAGNGLDAWDLAHWNDIALHTDPVGRAQFTLDWWYAAPDHRQPEVLAWGLSELIASAQDFGWDGVRFDGHWTAGNDALSAANMQLLKQTMWAQDPDFLFGFNWGCSFGYQIWSAGTGPMPPLEHEYRESVAGGGMHMQEGIRNWAYGSASGETYDLWSEYATSEEAAARDVRALGGSYHFIYDSWRLNPIDRLYKFAIGSMCGAHPVYGDQTLAPGCPSWGRFLTRWSSLVWDREMQPVSEGEVEVTAGTPLLWQNWAKQRVVDESSRQVIVHLLTPPPDDLIAVVDDPLPAPVSEVVVRVQVPGGQTVTKAMLLNPRQGEQATPLVITVGGGVAEVTVPQVEVWSIVVFEFSGSFTLPPPREQFTEVPDPAEVEAGRLAADPVVGGPLTPEELAGHRPWSYETDGGYNGVAAHATTDPEAGNGLAQVRYSTESSITVGRSWLGPFPPGQYVARMRIKLEDTNVPTHSQILYMLNYFPPAGSPPVPVNYATSDLGYPPERTLLADGVYHDYELPFEVQQAGHVHLIAEAYAADPAGTRLLMDRIAIEQLEAYTDAQLDPSPPPPPPVEIGGAPGLDVLIVKGFTWYAYRLPEAWGSGARVQELWWRDGVVSGFPQQLEDLAPYDEVILADMDVSVLSLEARRALRDYVAAGGGLVLLGGPYAFGQGFLSGTYVEDVLPVSVSLVRDLQQAAGPLVVTAAPTSLMSRFEASLLAQQPEVYWRHLIELRPAAEVQLLAGSEPVLVTGSYGEGRVTVFSGAALGVPGSGHLALWQWSDWPALLSDVVYWTGSMPAHTFSVSASASPTTVASGGAAGLSASAADSRLDAVAWSWSDGAAGGSFSPSNAVQNPTYTAPPNTTDSDLVVTLTMTATCDGPSPLSDSDSTTLTVQPVEHALDVLASADPMTVASGGSTSLTANYLDSRRAHIIAAWSWDDGGASGTFNPSGTVWNPSYTAPENTGETDLLVTLTVTGICNGPGMLSDSDVVNLTVQPAQAQTYPVPEVLLEVHPNERAPGASTNQYLGKQPWTQPTSSPAGSYWWKKYEFAAHGPLWIQVCAQNWDKTQKGYGDHDDTQLQFPLLGPLVPVDYDGIQSGAPGSWQWAGGAESGKRTTLRFLVPCTPGKQVLWIGADESPVLWWLKVTDLEPGVIEAF